MHFSTNAKEQKKIAKLRPSKKSVKVSFVTSGIEKWEQKVDDFLFSPNNNNDIVTAVQSTAIQCIIVQLRAVQYSAV